ncbi:hypothetical protein BS329_37695 [Amycolatopsis coloradensis]|uniref:Uncharacterized protein n=1 Tax=Amycolatopsis coloradensis TaxID=76021 RepID=A0A1R0KFL8_9PSEU|nr:hypothetical protein BS329_37695 [Amycolatopsis coloradensis]
MFLHRVLGHQLPPTMLVTAAALPPCPPGALVATKLPIEFRNPFASSLLSCGDVVATYDDAPALKTDFTTVHTFDQDIG